MTQPLPNACGMTRTFFVSAPSRPRLRTICMHQLAQSIHQLCLELVICRQTRSSVNNRASAVFRKDGSSGFVSALFLQRFSLLQRLVFTNVTKYMHTSSTKLRRLTCIQSA